ncbi:MAG: hypothetical protein ACLPHI_05210 [Terriglobales bacterium]|jgi:hypothetical protein
MQIEHEKDRPSKQKRRRDKTGPSQAQATFAAPLFDLYPVETGSMEQGEKNHDEGTDA